MERYSDFGRGSCEYGEADEQRWTAGDHYAEVKEECLWGRDRLEAWTTIGQDARVTKPRDVMTHTSTTFEENAVAKPPTIRDFKVYMPAKDFEQSKRFYLALGFAMSPGWGGTADFELNGNRFRLQNYYVNDWANNFMVVMNVDDVKAWFRRAQTIVQSGEFDNVRIKPVEMIDNALVLHLIDPSGVLLVFVQGGVTGAGAGSGR